jgi:glucose-6-phosphate isomerase
MENMSKIIHPEICDGCGSNTNVEELGGNELCSDCRFIAETISKDPSKVARILKLANLEISPESLASKSGSTKEFKGLPEVLDAVRFRTRDRDMNKWYVSISEIDGQPVEIFASTAFDRDHHLQSRISNLTTITRLISLILRHVFLGEVLTLEKTLKQLHRSSRQQNDLPDMLTRVLGKYSTILPTKDIEEKKASTQSP